MLTKEEVQTKMFDIVSAALGEVVKTVAKGKNKKEDDDDKGLTINVDNESLAKTINSAVAKAFPEEKPETHDEDDDEDLVFEDDYDAMDTKELKKECDNRDIKYFSKHRDKDLRKKLREHDEAHKDDGKTPDEINAEKISKATKEVAKALGLKPEDVSLNVKNVKKSKINKDNKAENHEDESDDEEYDFTDPAQLSKAIGEMESEQQTDLLDNFLGTKIIKDYERLNGKTVKSKKTGDDNDDDDD